LGKKNSKKLENILPRMFYLDLLSLQRQICFHCWEDIRVYFVWKMHEMSMRREKQKMKKKIAKTTWKKFLNFFCRKAMERRSIQKKKNV